MPSSLSIGKIKLKTNVILAPLTGCADLAFRLISRELGAGFAFLEMLDSNSLVRGPRKKVDDMAQPHPQDLPLGGQLLGNDPDQMLLAAKRLLEINPQISMLDINAACPVKKVIKKKCGSYLFKKPGPLFQIIEKLSTSRPLPITVKLRAGYSKIDIDQLAAIAQKCEASGAKALFVHGRTQAQLYSGPVNYEAIKAVKESVNIPVIASGNIFSPQQAKQALEATGADGVLVARGALGNPWIFKQIETYLETGQLLPEPNIQERLTILLRHLKYTEKLKLLPAKNSLGFCRKLAAWYVRGHKNARPFRDQAHRTQSFEELYQLIENFL